MCDARQIECDQGAYMPMRVSAISRIRPTSNRMGNRSAMRCMAIHSNWRRLLVVVHSFVRSFVRRRGGLWHSMLGRGGKCQEVPYTQTNGN